ncbi:uncharacterized protein LOC124653472 [Lolium rigidum]|uniref:uncharacterized protein LOC124653472 n=1 Tax=Lolium rigidum TaxID=89674 RepID=UPI001F5D4474|nr:uncharacterized protein LOC124653472 [Lolium rigidum]
MATSLEPPRGARKKNARQGSATTIPVEQPTTAARHGSATHVPDQQPAKKSEEKDHCRDSQPTPDAFAGASFSQHANESSQQTTKQSQQVASSMTIPTEGRLKWWVFGNENSSRQDGVE